MMTDQPAAELPIATPSHFSYAECLHFLDRGYEDCLYVIDDGQISRPLMLNSTPALLTIAGDDDMLKLRIYAEGITGTEIDLAKAYVSEWFDLERDLHPFYNRLSADDRLAPLASRYRGLRLMRVPDLLEALVWCIIGQQINLTFAHQVKRQLVEAYGESLVWNGMPYHFFPKVDLLASCSVADLKVLQFSRQKAEYTIGIAGEIASGRLSKEGLAALETTAAMLERLKRIRGVGPWTANYVLMKCLGRPDCVPYGDSGLQAVIADMNGNDRKPSRQEEKTFFAPFAGYESYLTTYLWRTLS